MTSKGSFCTEQCSTAIFWDNLVLIHTDCRETDLYHPAIHRSIYWDPAKAKVATSHDTLSLKNVRRFLYGPQRKLYRAVCLPAFERHTQQVIIDANEVLIEKPSLPELRYFQPTNTFKSLIGISPAGVITLTSKHFPGSKSFKELTRRSGLLQPLQKEDSVMADRGFDIQDELTLIGIQLNIPPASQRQNSTGEELVQTWRIASVHIHVERAIWKGSIFLTVFQIANSLCLLNWHSVAKTTTLHW